MKTLSNPRGSALDDLVNVAILLGLGFVGYKLAAGMSRLGMQPTAAHGASGAIMYDESSKALVGVGDDEIISDSYGNSYKVLPGGQEVMDIGTGIVCSAAILQTKYDVGG